MCGSRTSFRGQLSRSGSLAFARGTGLEAIGKRHPGPAVGHGAHRFAVAASAAAAGAGLGPGGCPGADRFEPSGLLGLAVGSVLSHG